MIVIALLFTFDVLNPAYGWRDEPVSNCGLGPTALLFPVYGGMGIAGVLILAWLLYSCPPFPHAITVYLVLMAAARPGLSNFPTDIAGMPQSIIGKLHLLFAVASFTSLSLAIDKASPLLATMAPDGLKAVGRPLQWTVATSLAAASLPMALSLLKPWFRLAERIFLLSTALWMGWRAIGS